MNESTALVPLAETMQLGDVLAKSGFFEDSRQAAQAVVKVLAGREIGIGPIASMTGIHIIKGKPAIGANLIASAIKRSGRYNYRITKHDNTICEITFFERLGDKWDQVGVSTFTIEDARKAGTQNLDKFSRNMLFARAISNGARWYTPDIFGGAPVYTPEEMGAVVDGDGDVIDVTPRRAETPNGNGGNGNAENGEFEAIPSAQDERKCTQKQREKMFAVWTNLYGKESLPQFRNWLKENYKTEHTSELTMAQASSVIEALQAVEANQPA
jgi:hypothetical protein